MCVCTIFLHTDVRQLQFQCPPDASTLTQSTCIRAQVDESDSHTEKSTQELKGARHFWLSKPRQHESRKLS